MFNFFKRPVRRGTRAKAAALTTIVIGIWAAGSGCGGGNGSANNRPAGTILYSVYQSTSSSGGGGAQIYAVAPSANAVARQLTTPKVAALPTDPVGLNKDASFRSDAKRIAFVSAREGTAGYDEVYVMNADGSEQQRITQTNDRNSDPRFHPNGCQIVYGAFNYPPTRYEIRLFDLDDLSVRILVPARTGRVVRAPVFSPDGRTLAYTEYHPSDSDSTPNKIFVMLANADGTGAIPLAEGYGPDFSPNGQHIVFAGRETGPNNELGPQDNIYQMNRNGTGRKLLIRNGTTPQFSPDGRRIAYSAITEQNRIGDIHVANRDGSQDIALPNTDNAVLNDWR